MTQKTRRPIRVATTIGLHGRLYTGCLYIGSQRREVHLLLDTGSSALAVAAGSYDPRHDARAVPGKIAQAVSYDDGSGWAGGVVNTDIRASGAGATVDLRNVSVAVAYRTRGDMFGASQGILGLGYQALDTSIEMPGRTAPLRYKSAQLRNGRKAFLSPYFTQLADAGLEAGQFGMLTQRFTAWLSEHAPADPRNRGVLVLGGGEEEKDLYRGRFKTVPVLSDDWWSVNLLAVRVGSRPLIEVPPPRQSSDSPTNAIVDSGTQMILMPNPLFARFLRCFTPEQARMIRRGTASITRADLPSWPAITFILQGMDGRQVRLPVPPEVYWQQESASSKRAVCGLSYGGGDGSILGLAFMNGYYTVFDAVANHGMGTIKFATPRPTAPRRASSRTRQPGV